MPPLTGRKVTAFCSDVLWPRRQSYIATVCRGCETPKDVYCHHSSSNIRSSQPEIRLPSWSGILKVGNRRQKYICVSFISKYLYIYQWKLFSKNIYLYTSKNLKVILKILLNFVILLCLFVISNFSGWPTRSFVEMLKGYMVRERLGTPGPYDLDDIHRQVHEDVIVGNWDRINCYDLVLLASSEQGFQHALHRFSAACGYTGIKN